MLVNTQIVEYLELRFNETYAEEREIVTFTYDDKEYQFYKDTIFPDNVSNSKKTFFLESINNQGELGFMLRTADSDYETVGSALDYLKETYPLPTYEHYGGASKIIKQAYIYAVSVRYGVTDDLHIPYDILSVDESVLNYGSMPYSSYTVVNSTGSIRYNGLVKLPDNFIPVDYIPPVIGSVIIGGDDIFFLYNLGSSLSSMGKSFADIISFPIGSTNLITLLLSSGFIFYMGWCIIKWFIPL